VRDCICVRVLHVCHAQTFAEIASFCRFLHTCVCSCLYVCVHAFVCACMSHMELRSPPNLVQNLGFVWTYDCVCVTNPSIHEYVLIHWALTCVCVYIKHI